MGRQPQYPLLCLVLISLLWSLYNHFYILYHYAFYKLISHNFSNFTSLTHEQTIFVFILEAFLENLFHTILLPIILLSLETFLFYLFLKKFYLFYYTYSILVSSKEKELFISLPPSFFQFSLPPFSHLNEAWEEKELYFYCLTSCLSPERKKCSMVPSFTCCVISSPFLFSRCAYWMTVISA